MAIVRWRGRFPTSFFDDENWLEPTWPFNVSETGLDIYETENSVVVEAQIPGVPEEEVDISVEGNVLTIAADHQETEEEKEDKKAIYRETRQRSFRYTTNLPRSVDAEKADASIDQGILRVEIPIAEEERAKKIEVKSKK